MTLLQMTFYGTPIDASLLEADKSGKRCEIEIRTDAGAEDADVPYAATLMHLNFYETTPPADNSKAASGGTNRMNFPLDILEPVREAIVSASEVYVTEELADDAFARWNLIVD